MKILLTLFVLFFSSSVVADDISDFEIEGMSVGDSLLDYFSENEIVTQYETTKSHYNYLPKKYAEVYLFKNLENYDYMSFFYNLNDKKYIIQSIRGIITFPKINECLNKQKELSLFVKGMFPNANYFENEYDHPLDKSGRSKNYEITYESQNNEFHIGIHCTDFEEDLRIKNNWDEGLSLSIKKIEVSNWLADY